MKTALLALARADLVMRKAPRLLGTRSRISRSLTHSLNLFYGRVPRMRTAPNVALFYEFKALVHAAMNNTRVI